jgi:hypothetical protein
MLKKETARLMSNESLREFARYDIIDLNTVKQSKRRSIIAARVELNDRDIADMAL